MRTCSSIHGAAWRRVLRDARSAVAAPIICVVLGAGCAIPPPPVTTETRHGPVLASSVEEADRGAGWLTAYYPRLREILPGTVDRRVEVWLQHEFGLRRFQSLPTSMAGFINETSGRIYLRALGNCVEQTLCHELVHALLDETWSTLPAIAEEGLCELVSIEVVGGCARRQRPQSLLGAAVYLQGNGEALQAQMTAELRRSERDGTPRPPLYFDLVYLSYRSDISGSLPPLVALAQGGSTLEGGSASVDLVPHHYGFGMWIVERIVERSGFAGLHQLCVTAKREGRAVVRPEDLLRAAGVGDPATWQSQVLQALRPEEIVRIVLDRQRELVAEAASRLRQASGSSVRGEDLLARARVKFAFKSAGVEVSLLEHEEFRSAMLEELGKKKA